MEADPPRAARQHARRSRCNEHRSQARSKKPAAQLGLHPQRLQALRSAGSCLALRGIEGAVPFLHGSQGCATYMRRYIISHFREPMDIAASGFSEASTIFGGETNLRRAWTM